MLKKFLFCLFLLFFTFNSRCFALSIDDVEFPTGFGFETFFQKKAVLLVIKRTLTLLTLI